MFCFEVGFRWLVVKVEVGLLVVLVWVKWWVVCWFGVLFVCSRLSFFCILVGWCRVVWFLVCCCRLVFRVVWDDGFGWWEFCGFVGCRNLCIDFVFWWSMVDWYWLRSGLVRFWIIVLGRFWYCCELVEWFWCNLWCGEFFWLVLVCWSGNWVCNCCFVFFCWLC